MSEILFADVDSQNVESEVLTAYGQIAGVTLYPGDPVRLFLESLAYTLALQNNVINQAGKQNLLPFATGKHLDYIGAMVGTARLGSSFAQAMQKFSLQEELPFDVIIPQKTRVTTSDGGAVFTTDREGTIKAGELSLEIPVTAVKSGAEMNGLVPGQINQMIDPVPYIAKTENTTMSLLGSDTESDERYRTRIQMSPEAYTCAGPTKSYIHLASSVHQDIAEVAVYSSAPGTVNVIPVLKGGELPTQEILEKVQRALSADDVRPLTDRVVVKAPDLISYDIDLTWYLSRTNEALQETTRRAIDASIQSYKLWQKATPGRDIVPDRLVRSLMESGARRVEIRSPRYTVLQPYEIARESRISVTYGGVEDD